MSLPRGWTSYQDVFAWREDNIFAKFGVQKPPKLTLKKYPVNLGRNPSVNSGAVRPDGLNRFMAVYQGTDIRMDFVNSAIFVFMGIQIELALLRWWGLGPIG